MSWARLDDAILDNPKIIAAGPLGFALHVAAITWCARNLSDGVIPKRRVAQLLDLPSLQVSETTKVRVLHALTPDDLATDLARIGLWHDRGEAWEVHDYLVYNPSAAEVLAERAARSAVRAAAGRIGGLRSGAVRSKQTGSKREANREANGKQTRSPVPVPVPVPSGSIIQESLFIAAPSPAPRAPSGTRAKPKTPWPEGLMLTPALRAYAERQGLDAEFEWGKFRDHALRNDVHHADWVAGWRYWIRNAWELARRRHA